MKIYKETITYKEMSIRDFEISAKEKELVKKIIDNGKENEFERLIKWYYPDGISESELEDELRFQADYWTAVLNLDTD